MGTKYFEKLSILLIISICIITLNMGTVQVNYAEQVCESSHILVSNAEKNDISNNNSLKNCTTESQITNDELNIYFYYLSGKGTQQKPFCHQKSEGDSFIIKIGDIEILVDGGCETGSATAIKHKMNEVVSSDNVWDYIIITHADTDHIAAFGPTLLQESIFSLFIGTSPTMTLNTLIDFDITQDDTNDYPKKDQLFTSNLYQNYTKYRSQLIELGITYYVSTQCTWAERGLENAPVEGAKSKFDLDGGKYSLNILHNIYSEQKFNPNTLITSADRNNLCVCFTIDCVKEDNTIDRFLFTGDLEQYDSSTPSYPEINGETELVNHNAQLKEGVVFYKAGHHGSRTSSSPKFIDAIKPQNVVITGVAGNTSYGHAPNSPESFPALSVTNNLFKFTDRIYIPALATYDENGNKSVVDYYGQINVRYSSLDGINVECTNNVDPNTGEPIPIQETEWFKNYRESFISVYSFSGVRSSKIGDMGSCTFIKYGHIDILIDCGVYAFNGYQKMLSDVFLKKVNDLCADKILEYVIVSSPGIESLQQMIDIKNGSQITPGILSSYKIDNLIDYAMELENPKNEKNSIRKQYIEKKLECIKSGTKYYTVQSLVNKDIIVNDDLSIDILQNDYYGSNENADICVSIIYKNNRMLFLGNNRKEALDNIAEHAKNHINNLNNVTFLRVPSDGEFEVFSDDLFQYICNKTSNVSIVSNTILNENFFDRERFNKTYCDKLFSKNNTDVYVSSIKDKNSIYSDICGDIIYRISYHEDPLNNDVPVIKHSINCSNDNITLDQTEYYKQLA